MRKLMNLAAYVLVALTAYPIASLAIRYLPEMPGSPVHFKWGAAVSFALALLVGLLVLPRRLSPLFAESRRTSAVAVALWVVVAQSIWTIGTYLAGNLGQDVVWMLRFTATVQLLLGLAAYPAARVLTTLLSVRFLPHWAVVACLPLFTLAYPKMLSISSPEIVPYGAAVLFVLVNFVAYQALMARRLFDGFSVLFYSLANAQWIFAAQIGWIMALYLAGIPDALPAWLPVATGLVEAAVAILVPIAYLALRGRLSFARLVYSRSAVEEGLPETAVDAGTVQGNRTAWIISYTGVSNEPRVRRQAEALLHAGWRVVVCGFDGHSPRPQEWTYIRLPAVDAFSPRMRQFLWFLRRLGAAIAVIRYPAALATAGALLSHWSVAHWLHIKNYLLRVLRHHADLKPDLVIANDYFTCDVALNVCRLSGARLVVDCHEYAVEQSSHDPHWVRWKQPAVRAVEAFYLARADLVTTVCEGIAELLDSDHRLRRPVLVIRSVPIGQPQPFRPTGERIRVLYHGGIWHVRQLHTAIESMRLWRPEFDLVLRGEGDPAYLAELRRLITRYGLTGRVFIEPAVPFEQIIPAANKADIGYFSYANFSRQSEFVLPNKFFEYIMAGLALCVVDLPEMAKLTRRYDLGRLIPEHSPQAIADTINSFTRQEIDRCKRASIAAAADLNWEQEKLRLLAAYNELLGNEEAVASREFTPAPTVSSPAAAIPAAAN
jgi:glycosyltransferase involved in cell wall biosynthesis